MTYWIIRDSDGDYITAPYEADVIGHFSANRKTAYQFKSAKAARDDVSIWRDNVDEGYSCTIIRVTARPRKGLYAHYKGDLYYLQDVAETHEHNGDRDCVYVSLRRRQTKTRPLRRDSRNQDSWLDEVVWPDGVTRGRFVPWESLSNSELTTLVLARRQS